MAKSNAPIDVWDLATFDAALRAELDQNAELIRAWLARFHAFVA